jgi:TolB-like protein
MQNPEKSTAVLPFLNESPVDSNKYFINGIMEEVLSNLQKIKDIRVVSRTSTDQYQRLDRPTIPEIAKNLDVSYIVEGSGQKVGNKFRLRVQLGVGKKLTCGQFRTGIRDKDLSVYKRRLHKQ